MLQRTWAEKALQGVADGTSKQNGKGRISLKQPKRQMPARANQGWWSLQTQAWPEEGSVQGAMQGQEGLLIMAKRKKAKKAKKCPRGRRKDGKCKKKPGRKRC